MAFDGEAFVNEMRDQLQASGRTLDQAEKRIERLLAGASATPERQPSPETA